MNAVEQGAGALSPIDKLSEKGNPFGSAQRIVLDIITDVDGFEPKFVELCRQRIFTGNAIQEDDIGLQCHQLFEVEAVVESGFSNLAGGNTLSDAFRKDEAGSGDGPDDAVGPQSLQKGYIRGGHADRFANRGLEGHAVKIGRSLFAIPRKKNPLRHTVCPLPRIGDVQYRALPGTENLKSRSILRMVKGIE